MSLFSFLFFFYYRTECVLGSLAQRVHGSLTALGTLLQSKESIALSEEFRSGLSAVQTELRTGTTDAPAAALDDDNVHKDLAFAEIPRDFVANPRYSLNRRQTAEERDLGEEDESVVTAHKEKYYWGTREYIYFFLNTII